MMRALTGGNMFIVVANPKGGVGKSTLATNLAVMFAQRKRVVTLFDADRQRSSHKWCLLRDNLDVRPRIHYRVGTGDISAGLAAACEEAETVIVDIGGKRGPEAAHALALADHLIVPMATGQFDVWALDDMTTLLDSVREVGLQFSSRVVLNNVPYHRNSIDVRNTRVALNSYLSYFQPCETALVGRGVFRDALTRGLAVPEADSEGKATQNLNELHEELFS
jgi:chromosome partitioning protein